MENFLEKEKRLLERRIKSNLKKNEIEKKFKNRNARTRVS